MVLSEKSKKIMPARTKHISLFQQAKIDKRRSFSRRYFFGALLNC